MPEKKHTREEIGAKLRQADVVGHRCTREAGSLSAGMKLPPIYRKFTRRHFRLDPDAEVLIVD